MKSSKEEPMSQLKALTTAVANAEDLTVANVRAGLSDFEDDRIYFAVRTAIEGPYELSALWIESVSAIEAPVRTTKRALLVDVTDLVVDAPDYFYIRWAILAGHDIPRLATYLLARGHALKLAEKPSGLDAKKMWFGERRLSKNIILGE